MKRLEITTMLVKIDSIITSNNKSIELFEESISNAKLRAVKYGTDESKNISDFESHQNEFVELNVQQEKLYRTLVEALELKTRKI